MAELADEIESTRTSQRRLHSCQFFSPSPPAMLCQPKSPELPTAEATWLRARRAAGLPERAGLPLRSRWRNGSRFSAHEWNAWSPRSRSRR